MEVDLSKVVSYCGSYFLAATSFWHTMHPECAGSALSSRWAPSLLCSHTSCPWHKAHLQRLLRSCTKSKDQPTKLTIRLENTAHTQKSTHTRFYDLTATNIHKLRSLNIWSRWCSKVELPPLSCTHEPCQCSTVSTRHQNPYPRWNLWQSEFSHSVP